MAVAAILFLTRTGQLCTEWRQEFILLSDVLGVSMLVDAINNRKPSGASESTVLGPFHVADAPELPMGANICLDRKGEDMSDRRAASSTPRATRSPAPCSTSGRPMTRASTTCSRRASSPTSTCAACSAPAPTAATGSARSSRAIYPIPDDGTVGKLLRALGRHPYRAGASALHPQRPGFETLTTHIFTPDALHQFGRGVRREGEPARRIQANRRSRAGETIGDAQSI